MFVSDLVKQQLAPTGVLRAGINLSNCLYQCADCPINREWLDRSTA